MKLQCFLCGLLVSYLFVSCNHNKYKKVLIQSPDASETPSSQTDDTVQADGGGGSDFQMFNDATHFTPPPTNWEDVVLPWFGDWESTCVGTTVTSDVSYSSQVVRFKPSNDFEFFYNLSRSQHCYFSDQMAIGFTSKLRATISADSSEVKAWNASAYKPVGIITIFSSGLDELRETGFCGLREWEIGKRYEFDVGCLSNDTELKKLPGDFAVWKKLATEIDRRARKTNEIGFYKGKVVFANERFKLTREARDRLYR